jgi:ADP-ribosylglycohydrolase/fructose-1,6-bisphosphatase/inositol monophosphatase family enzyme
VSSYERALEIAIAAAREAGDLLREDFHRPGGPRGKDDKADADVEAERLIRARLRKAFPDWGYLGEETGRVPGTPGAPVWLVDPNDGTRDYLVGRRGSSVSIGLVAEQRPVLGVVHPFCYPDDAGELFAWAEGCGPLTRDGAAVEVALSEMLSHHDTVLVSSKGDRTPEGNLRCAEPARFRAVASIAHRLALVAAGDASASSSAYAPGAWDYAAGQALLRASHGVLVNESGEEVPYDQHGNSRTRCAFGASRPVATELARRPWAELSRLRSSWSGPVRLKPGEAVGDPGLLARAQGCLLGQLAGDSLGSLVEFESASSIQARYPDGPRRLLDGGTWRTIAGQPTDDSELALALARAIVAAGGYDEATVLEAYAEWLRSSPFDVGHTTRSALQGSRVADSQSNGSLMRASPLAVFAHRLSAEEIAELARRDSRLTHPHAVCANACAAYVIAAAHAIARGDGAQAAYRGALEWARRSAPLAVVDALEAAQSHAPVCDGASPGFVLIALQNAFYELLHASSLEEGVVATVRKGGDTDTNAAVAGALLGAVHGRRAVPLQWRQMILSCRALAPNAPRPRPPAYWPTDALELAERLLLAGITAARAA